MRSWKRTSCFYVTEEQAQAKLEPNIAERALCEMDMNWIKLCNVCNVSFLTLQRVLHKTSVAMANIL